ncbi:MAG: cytochrome c oxidase subunit 3, partial [Firmicutes bacterium]|nr:cytochrome c oxidase subunit 3 [Bacillota bacterium]
PGRLIVGNAGVLVTRVLYLKEGETKTFVIVDAAMNDLVRPTLYDAHHEIRPVVAPAPGARRIVADVVGHVCESGDFLALDRELPAPQPGDLLAVMSSGAYGATFYTLIGAHAVHVLGALIWLAVTTRRLARGRLLGPRPAALRACAFYWHFVVALWPVLYVSVYLL